MVENPLTRFIGRSSSWLGLGVLGGIAGVLVTAMLTPLLAVGGITLANTIGIFDALPEYVEVGRQAQKNTIWVQKTENPEDGYKKIAEVYWQNREEVSDTQVSQYLKDAAVAGEDRRFFSHKGVDVQSIVRAAIGNVASGGITSGGSTLTMQLVKNIFVQRAEALTDPEARDAAYAEATASSPTRKLKEMKLAIGLEKRYTKDEILLAYLNISPFGRNTYGVQSAAHLYFGKDASDVTLAEAASLIAIVQYPELRNLGDPANFADNQARRDVILSAMLEEGFVTQAEYDEAIATPVDEEFVTLTQPTSGCIAADKYTRYFCDYVVKSVGDFESLGATEEQRIDNWRVGGYSLYTTLNYKLQKIAQTNVWKVPRDDPRANIGSVSDSIEVGTGRVLTMAQNTLFDDSAEGGGAGYTAVNFSTDRKYGGSSGFNTGSTYKVFALIAWLQSGRGLNEVVDASEFEKNQALYADSCDDGGGPWGGTWKFKNDSAAKPAISVMEAVRSSVNSAFASIAEQLDQCAIRGAAESLGVHRADGEPLKTNPAAVLGTNELAPMTLAAAWAGIANNGIYCAPIVLDHATTGDGGEIAGQEPRCNQAIDPEVAAAAAKAMAGVMNGGTGNASNPGGQPIIGKTGTADSSVQTWIVVSTKKVATATWVGNIVGKFPMRGYPNGASFRHQITRAIMASANNMYGGGAFTEPPARLLVGGGVKLPALHGLTTEEATALLEGLGFEVELARTVDSDLPEGAVVRTNPEEGLLLAKGMTIKLIVSRGNQAIVPNVSNRTMDEATATTTLHGLGFNNLNIVCTPSVSGTAPAFGTVVAQNPKAGVSMFFTRQVTLTVYRETC